MHAGMASITAIAKQTSAIRATNGVRNSVAVTRRNPAATTERMIGRTIAATNPRPRTTARIVGMTGATTDEVIGDKCLDVAQVG